MNIQTERFILRKLTIDDATQSYLAWFDDPVVAAFIESRPTATAELAAFIAEKNASAQALLLGIFSKQTQSHIGNIKFEPLLIEKKYAALGILIGDANWRGCGLSQEVILACCQHLFTELGISHFCLGVLKENLSAIRAYEKIGFIKSDADIRDTMFVMNLYL